VLVDDRQRKRARNRVNSGLVHSRYGNEINVLLSKASHFDEREKHIDRQREREIIIERETSRKEEKGRER
jgi:hypothetical protein